MARAAKPHGLREQLIDFIIRVSYFYFVKPIWNMALTGDNVTAFCGPASPVHKFQVIPVKFSRCDNDHAGSSTKISE